MPASRRRRGGSGRHGAGPERFWVSEGGMHMPPRFILLKLIAKALVKHVGNLAGSSVGVPVAGDIVVEVWEQWEEVSKEDQRRAEVETIARAAAAEVVASVRQVLKEIAAELPESARQLVEGYLTQVPAAIRQSLRRPADPTG